jgi:hypothetical protein
MAATALVVAIAAGEGAPAAERAEGTVVGFEVNECALTLDSGAVFFQTFEVDEIGASNCNQIAVGERVSLSFEARDGRNVVLELQRAEAYATGMIVSVDARSLTLSTGAVFDLSALQGNVNLRPGDEVTVRFTPSPGGGNVANSVTIGKTLPKAEF